MISRRSLLPGAIFCLALFPYVTPLNSPFDTQPWALIGAAMYVFALMFRGKLSCPPPILLLGLVAFYATGAFIAGSFLEAHHPLPGLRSLAGYVSLALLAIVGYRTRTHISVRSFAAGAAIWLVVGLLQGFLGADITGWIVPRVSTGGYRGLTSLAPEPSYYAMTCAAFIALNEIMLAEGRYGPFSYAVILVALLAQLALSASGTSVLVALLFLCAKGLSLLLVAQSWATKKIHLMSSLAVLAVVCGFVIVHSAGLSTRAGAVLVSATSNRLRAFQEDPSISIRLLNPVLALFNGIVETNGLGFGVAARQEPVIPEWLATPLGVDQARGGGIQGGLLSAVYELGVVGLALALTVCWIVGTSISRGRQVKSALLVSALVFMLPRFAFDSIAFPLFGYVLGLHAHYACSDHAPPNPRVRPCGQSC